MNTIPYLPVEIQDLILNIKIELEMKDHYDYHKNLLDELNNRKAMFDLDYIHFQDGCFAQFFFESLMAETYRIRFGDELGVTTDEDDDYMYD